MEKKKRIIAACDLSQYSEPVLKCAFDLARGLSGKAIIVNVINQRDIDAITYAVNKVYIEHHMESAEECIEEVRKERLRDIEKLIKKIPHENISYKITIRQGVPVNELVDAIHQEQADFVVIGTKGRANLASFLLGSTAEKMFRLCPVPLVSVRLNKDAKEGL